MKFSNPSHPKKIRRPPCLSLRAALEIARENKEDEEKIRDMKIEDQGEEEGIGIEQQQQAIGAMKSVMSSFEYGLRTENVRGKIEDKIKGKGREIEKQRTDQSIVPDSGDISNESERRTHRVRERVSLQSVILGRTEAAISGITSKPRLEQVTQCFSFLFTLYMNWFFVIVIITTIILDASSYTST